MTGVIAENLIDCPSNLPEYWLCENNSLRRLSNRIRCNLPGADLSGRDLNDANLSGTNLVNANLSSADLTNANLSRATMSNADLSDATSGAKLSNANLVNADLSGADFMAVELTGVISGLLKGCPSLLPEDWLCEIIHL